MNKQEVLDAMVSAGLERPRVIPEMSVSDGPGFLLCAGPNDPATRKQERVVVSGGPIKFKASKADVQAAIERLQG